MARDGTERYLPHLTVEQALDMYLVIKKMYCLYRSEARRTSILLAYTSELVAENSGLL